MPKTTHTQTVMLFIKGVFPQ